MIQLEDITTEDLIDKLVNAAMKAGVAAKLKGVTSPRAQELWDKMQAYRVELQRRLKESHDA